MMEIKAPLAGVIVNLASVPDPVFAQQMVGPGIAIDPDLAGGGVLHAVSPLAGTVGALHPHAYAIESDGLAVLVHLGIDTVKLGGAPFRTLVAPGDPVGCGQVIIEWAVAEIGDLSPLVPIVALGASEITCLAQAGDRIEVGEPLFTIP